MVTNYVGQLFTYVCEEDITKHSQINTQYEQVRPEMHAEPLMFVRIGKNS
jgi:hypothetical protein